MQKSLRNRWHRLRLDLAICLAHPVFIAGLPAVSLILYWTGGQSALMAVAIVVPLLFLLRSGPPTSAATKAMIQSSAYGIMQRDGFDAWRNHTFEHAAATGLKSAIFKVEIDQHIELQERYGQSAADNILETIAKRITGTLRDDDAIAQTGDFRFSICLSPVKRLDLELCIQLSGRVQTAIEEPVSVDGISVYVTGSVGFCQNSHPSLADAQSWTDAAQIALAEAQQNGPNAIRAFSDEIKRRADIRAELREDVVVALEEGQIKPWFQPQISTDTGLVTGFEALARWHHPAKGLIPPSEFLPEIERAGMLERLADLMMFQSLKALQLWDQSNLDIPQVGVNFAGPELNNPKLLDKVKWELDRFDLSPDRLAVEVLETVVADAPDDTITRNINALSALGCKIDLDDFGTGHASISSIRRFSVARIKIDRSFVIKSDRDPEQQRMIGAILTMAERLGVETLAEGVETVGEHALLAQLGCDHVQGFGIAKPMPFEDTFDWVRAHNAKLTFTPQILSNKSK